MSTNEKWFNALSGTQLEMLVKREEEQEKFKKGALQDIRKLIYNCCMGCRLKDHEIECDECTVHDIKKKYGGMKNA